ncbi:MarR family winged helix-turn-helix transcriptional regulator [Brevibacillus porteri]|uniref:MarR family transcriptional regulator n=1 Tax=Brevibacillus porteri TaxID=2126350 RepID=A0ABX5FWB8_9BACL|nr:MarR family winged helix-turn-helix transcriptional regulator [Brevibacillus porteri]MED1797716.1 MarR family winged helix-turn-helix transcriptional regulator [Brevibacillus porteri]MED2130544.1 MarR family winged helix-turn-helix transcriptional regulator [Brevibacillus porteri]MED2745292.1 MarR family winged helix-turn-helix transcriptional regulator [Brevibacillus porteri]MED2812782.1 MarR family winged helix-turn-helix transcriptional regulator [Brevibacillus porteri]MED2895243.1 MarR 
MNHQAFSELDLTSLLSLSYSTLIYELHDRLSELGYGDIRPAHGFMFRRIIPNGATGIELAEHLGITKQAVSKMVDYLVKSGYVKPQTHPTDKRGKIIVLTERGWSVVKAKEEILADIQQRWIENIGAERMQLLKEDLTKLVYEANEGKLSSKVRPVW